MTFNAENLPPSGSPQLVLAHPTLEERVSIWRNTSALWKDSLTPEAFVEESLSLMKTSLAKDGNMMTWILTIGDLGPDQRPILCSCETYRKKALTSDADGQITEGIVYGIASVFCPPEFRNRGYAHRHMTELRKVLHGWQIHDGRCFGSVLYSDIGKQFYAKLGWHPNPSNGHIAFFPSDTGTSGSARLLKSEDLLELCKQDEVLLRQAMGEPTGTSKKCLSILPDIDHMQWHHAKEDFATHFLFNKTSEVRGAISGSPGNQVWAVWARRYYRHPDSGASSNVLYILRLVVEGDETANKPQEGLQAESILTAKYVEQRQAFEAVLKSACAEAADWRLGEVRIWDPTRLVREFAKESGVKHVVSERDTEAIASGVWYDGDGGLTDALIWLNNEHYAWC